MGFLGDHLFLGISHLQFHSCGRMHLFHLVTWIPLIATLVLYSKKLDLLRGPKMIPQRQILSSYGPRETSPYFALKMLGTWDLPHASLCSAIRAATSQSGFLIILNCRSDLSGVRHSLHCPLSSRRLCGGAEGQELGFRFLKKERGGTCSMRYEDLLLNKP